MGYIVTVLRRFSRARGKSQRSLAMRRLTFEPLEHRALLSTVQPGGASPHQALAGLPAAAQQAISAAVGQLTASDGATGDDFGVSVSISGNTVVVGAPTADNSLGAAYLFTEPASGWANLTQVAKLTASDAAVNDFFGGSVSISGNTVVVGACNATIGANGGQGASYVFTEPASGWTNMTQTAKLTASDGRANDEFGASVSISGNTLVVGADNPYHLNARGRPMSSRSPPPVGRTRRRRPNLPRRTARPATSSAPRSRSAATRWWSARGKPRSAPKTSRARPTCSRRPARVGET